MKDTLVVALAFVVALGVAGPAGTDVWDTAVNNNDNGPQTSNLITHGFAQPHDLGAQPGPVPDEDWYAITQEQFSSYEVLVDGITGDVHLAGGFNPFLLSRVDSTGTVLQSAVGYANGPAWAWSLRFANNSGPNNSEFVRVANANCGLACDMSDQYRIRAWDTTIAVPRYNNSGTQVTVLLIQNTGSEPVSGNAHLWGTAGGTIPDATVPFTLGNHQASVINLASVAAGSSGTITITHDARYGQLAVKSVALEPSTGFSFDSPGQHKPVS
jgi:hypothetical protein